MKCLPAADIIISEMSQMLFLPLFSVYLALVSRVFISSSQLIVHHYKNLGILQLLLQVFIFIFSLLILV